MWIIGHRGASGSAPENTLASFRRAVQDGAGFLETDLRCSRDARLIAIHDDTLDRTTNGRGPVSARMLDDLRKLDAGGWFRDNGGRAVGAFAGERIPTIEEVIAFAREHDIGLYLEIKTPVPSGIERSLAGALTSAGEAGRSVVISFDADVLYRIRKIEPLLMTGLLCNREAESAMACALDIGARQWLPRFDRITRDRVEAAHRHDLKVVAWTVNVAAEMRRLSEAGVDGMMSDYPGELRKAFR